MTSPTEHAADARPDRSSPPAKRPLGKLVATLTAVAFLAGALAFLWSQWTQQNRVERRPPDPDDVSAVQRRSPFQTFDLENATVPRDEIRSGGPPVDGIPSLTDPKFVSAEKATFLKPTDRVIGVVFGKTAKAYPLKILDYHEAVNDKAGDVAFAVTYCPLCDSAVVFDRRTRDGVIEFGISGLLYNSNVLLYDRRKDGKQSLWSQMMTKSVAGPRVGKSLKTLPLELTTWADWSARHPGTQVLATETGYGRNYSSSPYTGYFRSDRLMFPVKPLDKRLPLKTRVLGVWSNRSARAYPLSAFAKQKKPLKLKQTIDGKSFTLACHPSAESLRITRADDGVEWVYSLWFAWAAFHEKSEIYKPRE